MTDSIEEQRRVAADVIARALAHDRAIHHAALLNTYGYKDFPPEVLAHDKSIGHFTYFPAVVLAKFAAGQEIDPPEVES